MSAATAQPPAPAISPAAARARFLFRLHRWTGLLGALPLFVILFSGVLVVFKDEIDEFANPALLVVQPGPLRVPLDAAVRAAGPGISRIKLPDGPTRPLLLNRARAQIAVDPYRGRVLGERSANGHLADVLRQLHLRFYFFGATGRIVVGAFGLLLAISGITGLLLYPRFLGERSWREVRWARGPQWIHSDLHKLLGVVSLAVNLLWALTGAVLGLENLTAYYRPAQRYLHPVPTVAVAAGGLRVSLDEALATAARAIPGFTPRSLQLPAGKPAPLVVHGNTGGSWTAPASSWVALDPGSGRVLQIHDERRAHPVTRVYNLHDPLHFGYFGGAATRWLWLVFGLAVSALPLTGVWLWVLKRRRGCGTIER